MKAFSIMSIPAAALAMALAPATAAAGEPPIEVEGVPTAQVGFADLDLASPAGVEALQHRIRGAAQRLCLSYAGGDLEERMGRRTCFRTAIASAQGQVQQAVAGFGRTGYAARRTITVAVR